MLASWQLADISDNAQYGGDFRRALAAISARAIVIGPDRHAGASALIDAAIRELLE